MSEKGYFLPNESINHYVACSEIDKMASVIAQNYIGNHPSLPPVYRITRHSDIKKRADHRYEFPFDQMLPEMNIGDKVYAWAKLWRDEKGSFPFSIRATGKVKLFCNSIKVWSAATDKSENEVDTKWSLLLEKGWNHFILELEKDIHGCRAIFGTANRKNQPFHFLAPTKERDGEEGWIFTFSHQADMNEVLFHSQLEKNSGLTWYPREIKEDQYKGQLAELYGMKKNSKAYAWTKLNNKSGRNSITLSGYSYGRTSFLINHQSVYDLISEGDFTFSLEVPRGVHDLVIISYCGEEAWGFTFTHDSQSLFQVPQQVKGLKSPWLYLGYFEQSEEFCLEWFQPPFLTLGNRRWIPEIKNASIRPFLENEHFGKWNYPLGVTLYGLLEISARFKRKDIEEYVLSHVEFATSTYRYSLWDKEKFGAPGLNNQLADIDSLDDCGSFGSLMLRAHRYRKLEGAEEIADQIADYIMNQQSRLNDRTLYRKFGVSPSMHQTMWCDDMYMSVPFLCQYAQLKGDNRFLDEAARQLLLYKKYLYMEELQLMSHVYHVKKEKRTNTPWGRANGWVLFSLTELLKVLDTDHDLYDDIHQFFIQLSEGIIKEQGENGLWSQVLTDRESYEEASCTAMFVYAFSAGVRLGWFQDSEKNRYLNAAIDGWNGLCQKAIDKGGNIFAICKGSSYSFSNHYYKYDLPWKINDPHGVGIVLLAANEILEYLE
ncbi:glycoside hydrolase family 105 protein [Alkalihalobacillus trypoxylicola]|uniref:Glycoside hydrolase n=1 Tax=Alkalihalobacillus trypoxylicola TaxID=519424 RepID=A0A162F0D5_9BACI|nr:glycoside hydrolase family 88 protein [Alkalihalobacillus trypoxylicola]KYG34164.1 hypothetical protein AZF04_15165 [Alkalihalobacillus trypoxylicola]